MPENGEVEWPRGNPGQRGNPRPEGRPSFPPPVGDGSPHYPVPNHMTWAITITVLGFLFCWLVALPLGIASIVFSSKANSMRADGYIDGAIEEAEKAKKFASAATICTVIGFIFLVVYVSSNQALF